MMELRGRFFSRPELNRLLEYVQADKVAVCLIKDQSRIGRDVLEVGLLKRLFEEHHVRLIAVNDNLDTANGFDMMSIICDVFNEYFVSDTSRKIRAVFRAKAETGVMKVSRPPYGYMRNPKDCRRLLVDKEAAVIVREIFSRIIGGEGLSRIATILNKRGVETAATRYGRLNGIPQPDEPHRWVSQQIEFIVANRTYIGERVLQRVTTPSYKNHKVYVRPQDACVFTRTTTSRL